MNWEKEISSFKYDGVHVKREKYVCDTPLGKFRVFQAVSGKWFIQYVYIGLDGDNQSVIKHAKIPCKDKDEGIKILEDKWDSLLTQMNKIK